MDEETIDAAPSEENGNLTDEDLVEEVEETPSEAEDTETPAEIVEEPTETPSELELVELPDGRKVDAATVAQEYRNLLSDYTRKSQELAAIKAPITEPANPLEDPEYVPSTYAELAKQIKEDTLRELEQKETQATEQRQALEDSVNNQLTEIKSIDPALNETALFSHATKYGFRDLKMAHQNMKDMSATIKQVQKTTADNIAKRTDPVSVAPGATGARPDPSMFSSSRDYLRSLKT